MNHIQHKERTSTRDLPVINPTGRHGDVNDKRLMSTRYSSYDDSKESSDEGPSRSESDKDGKEDENIASNTKKLYFTPVIDLELLREILNVRPYAAKHGFATACYQDVTANVNEHWETELGMRTIKERIFRLVKEFEATDSEYHKMSGVEEEYTENKQFLQDITDEMRDIETNNKKNSAQMQAKTDRLVTADAKLREQAVKRWSPTTKRDGDEDEASHASTVQASDPSTSTAEATTSTASSVNNSGTRSGAGLTTAQVNAVTVEFIEKQNSRRENEYKLLSDELSFKWTKAEKEARWKEEFDFRKSEAERNAKKWSEEVELRRSDIELHREELAVLKHRLGIQPYPSTSTQAIF